MIVLITVSLVIGGFCEIVPQLIQGAVTPKIAAVKPYTPLEIAGRDIYIREGCNTCHTQMIRTLRAEVERYGPYTRAGEMIYDRPFLWGSKRTGPDLWREGGKRNHRWHWDHMEDPTATVTGSTMPRYPWLYDDATDYASLPSKIGVLAGAPLWTPYEGRALSDPVADAKAQAARVADELREQLPAESRQAVDADREIIALIAYLQRLGTDLPKGAAK
jgi:cytochrome c oxidase cbb3-type subunit I/II